jgi:hypothetical protein
LVEGVAAVAVASGVAVPCFDSDAEAAEASTEKLHTPTVSRNRPSTLFCVINLAPNR